MSGTVNNAGGPPSTLTLTVVTDLVEFSSTSTTKLNAVGPTERTSRIVIEAGVTVPSLAVAVIQCLPAECSKTHRQ